MHFSIQCLKNIHTDSVADILRISSMAKSILTSTSIFTGEYLISRGFKRASVAPLKRVSSAADAPPANH